MKTNELRVKGGRWYSAERKQDEGEGMRDEAQLLIVHCSLIIVHSWYHTNLRKVHFP